MPDLVSEAEQIVIFVFLDFFMKRGVVVLEREINTYLVPTYLPSTHYLPTYLFTWYLPTYPPTYLPTFNKGDL